MRCRCTRNEREMTNTKTGLCASPRAATIRRQVARRWFIWMSSTKRRFVINQTAGDSLPRAYEAHENRDRQRKRFS